MVSSSGSGDGGGGSGGSGAPCGGDGGDGVDGDGGGGALAAAAVAVATATPAEGGHLWGAQGGQGLARRARSCVYEQGALCPSEAREIELAGSA